MEIRFATTKLQREMNDAVALQKNRGQKQAEKIKLRLVQLHAADNLEQLRKGPGRFHPLFENKKGWFACDLDGPYRLIFEPDHDPLPILKTGGLDWEKVTVIQVLGVMNYHERNKSKPV